MSGKITFHFDDGYLSHYEQVYPIFRSFGVVGCLSLIADPTVGMGFEKALEMQANGWEILSHSVMHPRMSTPLAEDEARREILTSKEILENAGFRIREFITPCSQLHESMLPMVASAYDAAFTVYTNSATEPIEKLTIQRPVNRYALHRACLSSKTMDELKAYVDEIVRTDAWLVFYEHDVGQSPNISADGLRELLAYIRQSGASVETSAQVLDEERCRTQILTHGWDGRNCFVHARIASDGADRLLITAQMLDTDGCDAFDVLHTKFSGDGRKSWTDFVPDSAFLPQEADGIRSTCCDMTPMFHRKTGKFLVTGHLAQYVAGTIDLLPQENYHRRTPYAVFDAESGRFSPFRYLEMPNSERFNDSGSGCSQCFEEPDGSILIPVSFSETVGGKKQNSKALVLRCTFDGENLQVAEVGNDLEVPNEVRGIGECSVIALNGTYFLTVRGDTYGYICSSQDGIHYTAPAIWRWEDGEIVPTYNTQSHFFTNRGKLYLVYTRKCGTNDHVFRHRAPLFVAEVNPDTLRLKRETEFVAVPERGARLGNFGVCTVSNEKALVLAAEWMQPVSCADYGSDNAIWLTDITR